MPVSCANSSVRSARSHPNVSPITEAHSTGVPGVAIWSEAQRPGNPDRMNYFTIARESREMAVTKRRVAEIERRKAERVVPIEKGRKKK
jgi:hypothetical protein